MMIVMMTKAQTTDLQTKKISVSQPVRWSAKQPLSPAASQLVI